MNNGMQNSQITRLYLNLQILMKLTCNINLFDQREKSVKL